MSARNDLAYKELSAHNMVRTKIDQMRTFNWFGRYIWC
jgi:hypothetical protein